MPIHNVNCLVPPVQDQIEAWDRYVAAVLSAMSFKDLENEQRAVDIAVRVANDLLSKREKIKADIKAHWLSSPN
ncbi:hypothetical protein J3D54_005529 [Pseudomonas sp. GGS8]|jgi:hypothetical protein|uniref:hypothetical protein n=1 Tax=Pseudomonas sp. GGS8 TaxID=2817892 RepID=UPI00209D63B6|nr:hypothetical protein [Pseudomonas sp. GGS8]MCP1446397.1 hypothetical protein [Pseudomonas sp. GGS8]